MEHSIKRVPFTGFGVKNQKDGVVFCAGLKALRECGVLIYDKSTQKLLDKIPFDKSLSYGEVYSCLIKGLPKDFLYRFYEDEKIILDPYANSVFGNEVFGGKKKEKDLFCEPVIQKAPKGFDSDRPLMIPYEDSFIYEAHVRGLTMADPSVRKNRGTFSGLESKIGYLKKLGVTALLLMPVYEFIEREDEDLPESAASVGKFREPVNSSKVNYWGFCKAFPFAVKKSYASGDASFELKHLVMSLHEAGIECILTVHFDVAGDIDRLKDIFKYYIENFHVDGFRLIGGRNCFEALVKDPFFKGTKLIFESVDTGCLAENTTYKNVALLNDDFLRNARRFLKSDEDTVATMSFAVRENSRFYSPVRNITDFSGFTLKDTYSFSRKHNEANNEENTDGTDYNYSWNCGTEGSTNRKNILKLRAKLCRNAMLMLFLSQGTPMINGGDEVLNSSDGNNNPYCQDNETGWVTYGNTKTIKDFKRFLENLSAFRKRHVILHQKNELKLFDYLSCRMPDVSFHGEEAWKMDQNPASKVFAVLYSGEYARQYTGKTEDSVYVVYNMHWESVDFVLPVQGPKVKWSLLYSSDGSTDDSFDEEKAVPVKGGSFKAPERSISILLLKS